MSLRRAFLIFASLALAVSACGGGGGSSPAPGGGSTPTPCPANFSGTAPGCTQISASGTIAIGTTPSSATLPSLAGYTASVQLPSASAATTASVTTSSQPPSGVTALSSVARRPRTVNTPLLYFTLVPNATVTLNGIPGFTVTLPASVSSNQSFYIAVFQAVTGWQSIAGPGVVSGQTVTFAPAAGSVVLTANQPLYFALYAGGVVPSPSPTPSPVPTFTPSPTSSPSTASAAHVYLTDNGELTAAIQHFTAQNGVVQQTLPSAHQFRVTSAAVAPDSTVYASAYQSSTGVGVFTRDLTFLRTIAPAANIAYLATDGGGNVYVSVSGGIEVYPPNATAGTPPLRVMNVPQNPIAVDAHGDVISLGSALISVYPPNSSGTVAPTRTITPASGIVFSSGVSADTANNIYVTGTLSGQNAVFVYAPTAQGAALPSRIITGPHANVGTPDIAVDAAGYVYVCCTQSLQSYAPGANGDVLPVGSFPVAYDHHAFLTSLAVGPNAVTSAGPP
jgi:hypothetical protein